MNDNYKEISFDVPGAGQIFITETADYQCGTADGFGLDCSWGKFGKCGGVIDKADARRLAEHILAALANHPGE